MKKLLIIILILAFASPAGTTNLKGVTLGTSPTADFCAGTLFCYQETAISWDDEAAVTDDCSNNYDGDGDFCDQDDQGGSPNPLAGTYGMGITGAGATYYVEEGLTGSNQEFYIDSLYETDGTSNFTVPYYIEDTGGTYVFQLICDGSNKFKMYYDNGTNLACDAGCVADTTYRVGIHVKVVGSNGIAKLYVNEDLGALDSGDLDGTCDLSNISWTNNTDTADKMRIHGASSTKTNYVDNYKIVAGAPSW